jgi:nucleoside-diphosphate-sugar epimerase
MSTSNGTRNVLLTGGTGYLGSLIAATLLVNEDVQIVLPVRKGNDLESIARPIRAEIEIQGGSFDASYLSRLHLVELPPFESLHELDSAVGEFGVREIIHCAGCLDYFDRSTLETVNVNFTRQLLEQGRRWDVRRFVYISTSFSSGYLDSIVPEQLHDEPLTDPTDYTRTKREAERLVAGAGLPYHIIRPSIVIGDSRDGHYSGKQYGLYQLWSGMARLLCREWNEDIHALAPEQPLSLLHQDAFQKAFLAAFRMLPDNSILNLVSEHDELPYLRELWQLWVTECLRPRLVYYYLQMSDIPMREINTRQRALLGLASVNLEIASHPWRFETTNLRWLRERGLEFPETTLETVARCQRRFVEESAAVKEFLARNTHRLTDDIQYFEAATGEALTSVHPFAAPATD